MNGEMIYCAPTLPSVEMYAGDAVPWYVGIVKNECGETYVGIDYSQYTAELAFTPYGVGNGMGQHSLNVAPVVLKEGRFVDGEDGATVMVFDFAPDDTMMLRGKFIYQITLKMTDGPVCINQGSLLIKQNINRQQ